MRHRRGRRSHYTFDHTPVDCVPKGFLDKLTIPGAGILVSWVVLAVYSIDYSEGNTLQRSLVLQAL